MEYSEGAIWEPNLHQGRSKGFLKAQITEAQKNNLATSLQLQTFGSS